MREMLQGNNDNHDELLQHADDMHGLREEGERAAEVRRGQKSRERCREEGQLQLQGNRTIGGET